MFITTATYPTVHGAKYIAQLCKHFAHKVEVEFDDVEGRAALPSGALTMRAEPEALRFRIEAPDAKAMIQARFVVDSHLVTFAHREGYTGLSWAVGEPVAG